MIKKQDNYSAAIYCRLSQDDGMAGESGSIQTQKTMLTKYCLDNGYSIYSCYVDDGWSGTNFDRPDFQRMMNDIYDGSVNLVVVKDLSRFGREYAQMGMIVEHEFDEYGVRFIAIADGFDNLNGTDALTMPIKNVINSVYAKETSNKVKAAHRTRAEAGMFIAGKAPYGYIKDPDNRHHLLVDPEAADVVRFIFRKFSEGVGYVKLTKILREKGILNPLAYFNQNNPDYYDKDYWRQPHDWHATSIRMIISNPVYIGATSFGKTRKKGFYNKTRVHIDESEWIVREGMHEAIIDQNLWDTVQRMRKKKRRTNVHTGAPNIFVGLVKCADCGSALNASYDSKTEKYRNVSCWVYKNYGPERCSSHAIGWKTLNQIVLTDIRRNAMAAVLYRDKYLSTLLERQDEKTEKDAARFRRRVDAIEKRMAELERIIVKLFEQSALGQIPEERATSMMNGYENENSSLQSERENLVRELEHKQQVGHDVHAFMSLIVKYSDIQELDTAILNELIDRIVVHEKEKDDEGNKTQRVDIHYRFVGFPLAIGARDENHLGAMLFSAEIGYGLEMMARAERENKNVSL